MITKETIDEELAAHNEAFEKGHYIVAAYHARMLAHLARDLVHERDLAKMSPEELQEYKKVNSW